MTAEMPPNDTRHDGARGALRRPSGGQLRRAAAAVFFSAVFALSVLVSAAEPPDEAYSRLYFGLQRAVDRDLQRTHELAIELIEAGRYSEVGPLIGRVFATPHDQPDEQGQSRKNRLLSQLVRRGPTAVSVVRSLLGPEHDTALADSSSVRELHDVVRRYPPEVFGNEALVRLGHALAESGQSQRAADVFAIARGHLSESPQGKAARSLARSEATNRLRLGEDIAPSVLDPDELARLSEATSTAAAAIARRHAPAAWLAEGGDAQRLAAAPGEPPIPWRDWRAPLGDLAASDEPMTTDSVEVVRHAAIAVEGIIVTSTLEGLVACSAATGKRLWTVETPREARRFGRDSGADADAGGIATDGRCVYAVAPTNAARRNDTRRYEERAGSLFGRSAQPSPPNALLALQIASAGKLVWKLDGGDRSGPLAGARFLGPPAVYDHTLYALVEREQEIRLVKIDSPTGTVTAEQALVQYEQAAASLPGAVTSSPTIADGVVYCATGRGALAAYDAVRQRLAWVRFLAVDEATRGPNRRPGWPGMGRARRRQASDERPAWRHCRVLVSDGVAVVASPALPSLQAFDIASGDLQWRRPAEEGLLLATATRGLAMTLDAGGVSAWRLADGESAWNAVWPDGDRPTGEGLLLDDAYLVPLASNRFGVVRPSTNDQSPELGYVVPSLNRLDAPVRLGNLIYHEGGVISRSATTLERFAQPRSIAPAERAAIAAWEAGRTDQAVEAFRRLWLSGSAPPRTAEQLAGALLSQVENDQAGSGVENELATASQLGRELPELVSGPLSTAHAALLRLSVAAANADVATATDEAVNLVLSRAADVFVSPERGLEARADRLAAARLHPLIVRLDTPERSGLREERDRLLSEASSEPQRRALGRLFAREIDGPANGAASASMTETAELPAWTLGQVITEVATDPSSERAQPTFRRARPKDLERSFRLSGDGGRLAIGEPTTWRVATPQGTPSFVVGTNPRGESVFAAKLPRDVNAPSPSKRLAIGAPGSRRWNGWLALDLDAGFVVYRTTAHHDSESEAFRSSLHEKGIAWDSQQAEEIVSGRSGKRISGAESPIALGPWGVVSTRGSTLVCRTLAEGTLLWRRELVGPSSGEVSLLSLDDDLYVAIDDESTLRLSAWTGELGAALPPLPPARSWRGYADGHLLIEERSEAGRRFRLIAIDTPGAAPLWERAAPPTTRFVPHGAMAAFVSEDLRFSWLDIRSARERFSVSLPGDDEFPVRDVRLTDYAGRLLVEVDRSNPMVNRARGESSPDARPLLTGELHCLDPVTGASLWRGPASVDGMALLATGVTEAPVLLLGRREAPPTDEEQAEPLLSLVALDLWSGGTLYRGAALPAGVNQDSGAAIAAHYENADAPQLLLRAGRSWITLRGSDRPAPPRTPMISRIEAPRPSDLNDVGRKVERLFESFLPEN